MVIRHILVFSLSIFSALPSAYSVGHAAATIPPAGNEALLPALSSPSWSDLTKDQRSSLEPLKNSWAELSDVQRRKWIAIVKNFNSLSPDDQEKIRNRMANWASLQPSERENARENFAKAKQAANGSKASQWEEYQALPKEERERLAAQANSKKNRAAKQPKSAAIMGTSPRQAWTGKFPDYPARGELRLLIDASTLLPTPIPTAK